MALDRKGAVGSVAGLVLVGLSACSSGGQSTEQVCEAAPPGEVQQECMDSGTGEGPMDDS